MSENNRETMKDTAPKKTKASRLDKVKQLTDLLHSQTGGKGETTDFLNSSTLATSLFARAPGEFLEQKSLEDLSEITRAGMNAIEEYLKAPRKVYITCHAHDEYFSLFVLLSDRPFIINTITETLRDFGIDIKTFLHPILKGGKNLLSLCYLEIDPLSTDQKTALVAALEEALSQLIVVTDDFTAMLVRVDTLSRVLDSTTTSHVPQADRRELIEFLRVLTDGGFVFLGHAEWRLDSDGPGKKPRTTLGIYKTEGSHLAPLVAESLEDTLRILDKGEGALITRMRSKSLVHRRNRLLNITVKEPSPSGAEVAVHSIVGLLTSKARGMESSGMPLIRRKLQKVIEREEAMPNSFVYKSIVSLVDNMPKDEALRLDPEALHSVVQKTIGIHSKHGTKIAVLADEARRGVSIVIVMPRDRFNTGMRLRLQQHVEDLFSSPRGSSEYLLDVSDKTVARFYFSVPTSSESLPLLDERKMEEELATLTKTWRDLLEDAITGTGSKKGGRALWKRYGDAFSSEYQATQRVDEALSDIKVLETLSKENPLCIALAAAEPLQGETLAPFDPLVTLVLYNLGSAISISKALPILENAGLEVMHERAAKVTPLNIDPVFIHRLLVRPKLSRPLDQEQFRSLIAPGLTEIFLGRAANDPLNLLLVTAGLDIRAVSLLRTYAGHLSQINKFATRHAIYNTLAQTPKTAIKLWEMFETKFNPKLALARTTRVTNLEKLSSEFRDILASVTDLSQDRILKGLVGLLEHTVRTNFYTDTAAVALKVHSEKAEIMPQPRPLYEIYVSSPLVEGIHLRSSMVARGGLRWSDRKDDYRTEVLGLMKTQKTKNVVIVPSGAKGGFIAKNLPEDPSKARAGVEAAYKEFIRALLSVTDNYKEGKIVHPENLVVYDGEDPYFVVAADKGTATFSDFANKVAVEEYSFWLGDAFASGGSNGYDHKVYAITARGAWECAKRHFKEAGINFEKEPFTVVGIGDMSGDVFGNGLLMSNKMKLIAAFDHRSIFIDPSPDPESSFAERKRLFELKGSKWEDYSKNLISKGGGVWKRLDKEIQVSSEIRAALSLPDDAPSTMNGEQLITYILKAKADLLWNGGIGTYVKSSTESNPDVNDSANDRVRVNGNELRVRVVAEGGNLGFTQKARCEYAQLGGRINTDAIDNSGGVDLSDHEVNLKILFAKLIREGKLTLEKRNQLLKEMAPEVIADVLAHNKGHALSLTLGEARSKKNIEYIKSLIKEMAKRGYLSRVLESLPEDEELDERASKKHGLLRPEIAVLLAVVKMWTKDTLLASSILEDKLLAPLLLLYFPTALRKLYKKEIEEHSLAKNIIATQVTNTIVDTVGISFFHRLMVNQGALAEVVVQSAIAADAILGFPNLREEFQKLDTVEDNSKFVSLYHDATRALRATGGWLVSTHGGRHTLSELVDLYKSPFETLVQKGSSVLGREEKNVYDAGLKKYLATGLPKETCERLALFPLIIPALEVLYTSRSSKKEVALVAEIYAQVLETLRINKYVTLGQPIETHNRWDNELRVNSYEEIRRGISSICCSIIEKGIVEKSGVIHALKSQPSFDHLIATITEISEKGAGPAALSVIAKQIRLFKV